MPGALMRPALTKTLISCLWYRWGRSSMYLPHLHIPFLWWEEAQPKNLHVDFYIFTALLPQSMLNDDLFVVFLGSGFIYVRYFRKTYTLFAKYNREIYFRSNYVRLLHVTGISSWWVSSKIQFCVVCGCVCVWFFFDVRSGNVWKTLRSPVGEA